MRRDKLGRYARNINSWIIDEKRGLAYCFSKGELLFFTDLETYQEISGYVFGKMANGYSCVRISTHNQMLTHRLISKPKDDEVVDHINRNKKDNRKCNLRNTNKSVNAFNSKINAKNTSGCTGVWFRKDLKKWCAEIKKDGIKRSLGVYEEITDAISARKKAEVELYGA